MRLNEIVFAGRPPVDGYGPGGFRIAGAWREGALLLLPSGVHRIEGLTLAALAPLVAAGSEIELALVGLGAEGASSRPDLPPDLRKAIREAGPEVETMSTPSACRTYNVLLAENRRIAAALDPV